MRQVSLSRCTDYSNEILKEIIVRNLEAIGFRMDRFNKARVALKPNLILPATTDKAIVTDPEFFRAVAQIVREHKGTPVLIESPAIHSLERTIRKTEYGAIIDSEGIEVADPGKSRVIHHDGSKTFKSIEIQSALFDVDIILNLPKFKMHGLTYVTGAVKNLFGAMPGRKKAKMHVQVPAREDFADFLLDLYGALKLGFDKPKTLLHVMDAIMVQEGDYGAGRGRAGAVRDPETDACGYNR